MFHTWRLRAIFTLMVSERLKWMLFKLEFDVQLKLGVYWMEVYFFFFWGCTVAHKYEITCVQCQPVKQVFLWIIWVHSYPQVSWLTLTFRHYLCGWASHFGKNVGYKPHQNAHVIIGKIFHWLCPEWPWQGNWVAVLGGNWCLTCKVFWCGKIEVMRLIGLRVTLMKEQDHLLHVMWKLLSLNEVTIFNRTLYNTDAFLFLSHMRTPYPTSRMDVVSLFVVF